MTTNRCQVVFSFLSIAVTFFTCTPDEPVNKHEFIGRWYVSQAQQDAAALSDWTGIEVVFDQITYDSGRYTLSQTQDDSVWNVSGTWAKSENQNNFVRNDNIVVYYGIHKDVLYLSMWLPWTQESTCSDGICLPIVTGNWDFELKQL
jgi:hypothetical protein